MAILLLAEWDQQGLLSETRKALSAAQKLAMPIDVLAIGDVPQNVKETILQIHGVNEILLPDTDNLNAEQAAGLENSLAEPIAALLASNADKYCIFMAAATSFGKNIMPRLSGLLQIPQVSDLIDIISPDSFKRPIYAGNVVETVRVKADKKILTIRSSAFPEPVLATHMDGDKGDKFKAIDVSGDVPVPSRFVGCKDDKHEGQPDLGSAKIVVSGGRGLGSAEDFKQLLEPLALKLQAAIGASRAAVDAEFAPNDRQVGQTGRIVSPDLYIAIGLSGAVQHIAGMSDSKVIVAINKDPEAPIFQIADYGLVGDLFEIVPLLTEKI